MLHPSSCGLEARALQGHAPLPRRIVSPPLPQALGGGAGRSSRNAGLGARRPGHIPGETPGSGGMFAQLDVQLKHPTNFLGVSPLLRTDPLAGNPRG